MPILTRTVRFSINPPGHASRDDHPDPNGYGGSPSMRGLGRHYELDVRCAGPIDAITGYIINIKDIDQVVRARLVPLIQRACDEAPGTDAALLLPSLWAALHAALPSATGLLWRLSPYYCIEMRAETSQIVLLKQRFDFAAAHRLHAPSLSAEQNRQLFGKCNNSAGHGHNYQFEPCIALDLGTPGNLFTLQTLERIAEDVIVQRFDHKNLSTDAPEFAPGSGVNPSVEHIARVFYTLLAPAIRSACPAAELRSITVWETDRTSSTFPG